MYLYIYVYVCVCTCVCVFAWVDPYASLPTYVIIHLILCTDWRPRSAKKKSCTRRHGSSQVVIDIQYITAFSDKVSYHSSYLEGIPKKIEWVFFMGWCSQLANRSKYCTFYRKVSGCVWTEIGCATSISVYLLQTSWSMSRLSKACAIRSSSGGRTADSGATSSPHKMCGGISPWYSSWSSGISAPLSTCTRRSHSRPPLHARSVPLKGQSGRRQVCFAFRTWAGATGRGKSAGTSLPKRADTSFRLACLLNGWNGPSASMALRNRSVSFPCCSSSRTCTGHPAPALQLSGFGHDGRQQGPWARTRPFVPTQSHFAAGGACCGRAKGCKTSSGTTSLPPARRLAVLALCTTFLACP